MHIKFVLGSPRGRGLNPLKPPPPRRSATDHDWYIIKNVLNIYLIAKDTCVDINVIIVWGTICKAVLLGLGLGLH